MRCLTLLCCFLLCVNTTVANPLDSKVPVFDIKQANRTYDQINLQLSVQNLSIDNLNAAINTLNSLKAEADNCVETAQKQLTRIESLIQESANVAEKNAAGADQVYLAAEKKKKAERLAQCRLFFMRAKEAIDAYTITTAQLTEKATFAKNLPLWDVANQLMDAADQLSFDMLSAIKIPHALQSVLVWVELGCIALLMSFALLFKLRKSRSASHYLRIKKLHFPHILLLSACLMASSILIYLSTLQQDSTANSLFLTLSQQSFFYLIACLFTVLFFKIKLVEGLLRGYSLDLDFFRSGVLFFLSFYTLATMGSTIAENATPNNLLWQLSESLFLLSVLVTEIYLVYYFCHAHRHLLLIKKHGYYIRRIFTLIFLACILMTILGYHALALRITSSGLTTLLIVFVTILIIHSINKSYSLLTQNQQINTKVVKYFGYKKDQVFTEFLILKMIAQVIIITISLYLIVRDWEFAIYYIEKTYDQVLYGVHLANTTIYPTRIVMGIVVYCMLYLLFRGVSTAISRQQQFEGEEETQVAIASIFTYIGFALALISALLVAGFNFTGLAIVAGALSVGIGLGLQSIVNNFVSGLILLIEKPIKAGDRINIDGVEGFVKKIRVRSTHIITPAHEDIIVPNSDLITRRVTNYMYTNKQISICCDINVPLGSDTQQVRELLLQAANNHEDVIKTGRNKPLVLFHSFGEKALLFQLCCLIKDVNKKQMVQSDLNFAIDTLLRGSMI